MKKNTKSTKQALVMSVLSMLLCVSTLMGTTFAWFTDESVSGNNIIKSGILDVELNYKNIGDTEWTDASQGAIFDYQYWEPGYTEAKYVQIANVGNLALRYRLSIIPDAEIMEGAVNLADVIEVRMIPAEEAAGKTRAELLAYEPNGTLASLMTLAEGAAHGILLPEASKQAPSVTTPSGADAEITYVGTVEVCVVLHMMEEAGNEYQNLTVGDGFSVQLLATQYTYENDTFDHLYDEKSEYPAFGSATLKSTSGGVNIQVRNGQNTKVGAVTLPATAVADIDKPIEVRFNKSQYKGNFTIDDGMETHVVDITVSNIKEGNTDPIQAQIRIAAGLDPDTVKLYHYDEPLYCTYNPTTGYVICEVTGFSPFTVVFDAESDFVSGEVTPGETVPEETVPGETVPDETVPGETLPEDLPEAIVTENPEYVNVDLEWGNFGQWSPTEGMSSQLECAYTFTCKDTPEEAEENPYAYWYCDFYVSLDRDLGENQLFLGGNYGSFGWIGFHNGDVTLPANEELGLLEAVTTNPWTYADIASFVGTFTCGVGDVDDALSGATFTVMLRLTNPEDTTEFYNVAVINYTFE